MLLAGILVAATASPAAAVPITSAGPLTRVEIGPLLNCAVSYAGDAQPQFFGDTACATLLAVGGTLFGPAVIPFGSGASPRTAFTAVSQSPVTGGGTSEDPYTIVTVVRLGATDLSITQTDSYVVGREAYRTDVTVTNSGTVPRSGLLYRAGDCYLQDSDWGFGSADPATGAVACVAGVDDGHGTTVGGPRIEQWVPLSPGSRFMEGYYHDVWSRIGAQLEFLDTCACDAFLDNGAGLSWSIEIPPGGSVTRSHLTNFSPQGRVPLTLTKTVDRPSVSAGGVARYTITVHNPNTVAADLASITDALPEGFTYRPGSTTGATGADPSVDGQGLTWEGPFVVPAEGTLSLSFAVTVGSVPGKRLNEASAESGSFVVLPTGPTAPVTVLEGPVPTTTTYTGAASVQYSDPVAVSGALLGPNGEPVAGRILGFVLGTQSASAGPTDVGGSASTELAVTQAPGSVSTVQAGFAGDDAYGRSSDTAGFSIEREECTLAYEGETRAAGGSPATLAARLGEPDLSLGDRSGKSVTFAVTGPNGEATLEAITDALGDASVSVELQPGTYGVEVAFAGDGFYLPCGTTTSTELTVMDAGPAKVTGGGHISAGGRTSVAFEVIRDERGLRGQLQVVARDPKGRFHAGDVLGFEVWGDTATWWGTGAWNGVPGYAFAVRVVDRGPPGRGGSDTVSILVLSPLGMTVYSSGGPQPLEGGNLSVR